MVGMGTSKVIATLDNGATCNTIPYSLFMGCVYRTIETMKSRLSMADGSHRRPVGMARNVAVKVNGATVCTDFIVLKDVREEEKCGPDIILLGWPFLCASKMDISPCRRIASYDIDGNQGTLKALDGIPEGYIRKEYSAGFVKHMYIVAKTTDRQVTQRRAGNSTGAP